MRYNREYSHYESPLQLGTSHRLTTNPLLQRYHPPFDGRTVYGIYNALHIHPLLTRNPIGLTGAHGLRKKFNLAPVHVHRPVRDCHRFRICEAIG